MTEAKRERRVTWDKITARSEFHCREKKAARKVWRAAGAAPRGPPACAPQSGRRVSTRNSPAETCSRCKRKGQKERTAQTSPAAEGRTGGGPSVHAAGRCAAVESVIRVTTRMDRKHGTLLERSRAQSRTWPIPLKRSVHKSQTERDMRGPRGWAGPTLDAPGVLFRVTEAFYN